MDLIIRNAQLLDQPAGTLRDVGIQGGKIVAIEPSLTADAQNFDAGGRLACAGLIETHIHLD
ncbi:MAG: amidohydrolase, partial [Alphaproteobacteria bacterium]|nr:amidohydrolase [Alphaproteobacteria bacterium]